MPDNQKSTIKKNRLKDGWEGYNEENNWSLHAGYERRTRKFARGGSGRSRLSLVRAGEGNFAASARFMATSPFWGTRTRKTHSPTIQLRPCNPF
jgi:hypothetical protein